MLMDAHTRPPLRLLWMWWRWPPDIHRRLLPLARTMSTPALSPRLQIHSTTHTNLSGTTGQPQRPLRPYIYLINNKKTYIYTYIPVPVHIYATVT